MSDEQNINVFWCLKKFADKGYETCQYFLIPIDEFDAETIPYIFNGHDTDYWIGIVYAPNRKYLSVKELSEIRDCYIRNDNITGYEYEQQCADDLWNMGFTDVEVTKSSGDQGIDVIAWKDGLKYGFQCKHYTGSVPNKAVQEAHAGADFYGCNVAVVMTNATFTESAKELAHKIGVRLWSSNDKYKEI